MKKIFLAISFILIISNLPAKDEIYFMPYEQKQALKTLIDSIKSAQNYIDISIYSFTNREIAKSLKDVARKGVKIKIIYDKESNIDNPRSSIGYLSKYNNIKVCLLQGKRAKNDKYNGIMHQKMAIIDNKTLIIGSANWSKNAFENNYEILFKSNNKLMIEKSMQYFNKMFSSCKPY